MKFVLTSILLQIIQPLLLLIATFKWGDWRNWEKYYPTILFIICLDFFSSILMYEHPLWIYKESLFLPNHTLTDFFIVFIMYPTVILLFLANCPSKRMAQIGWILLWITTFSVTEFISVASGLGAYENGWNFGLSVLFNCVMFPILYIHHHKPLLAWLLALSVALYIILSFHFPIETMK
ncbi:CBO0543 family protein [Bacillus piscicola]|uniref:CBO0543 family protein n=1 Tax=Bacillus piscicola TaxID=1632684 RepID=UPI003084200F